MKVLIVSTHFRKGGAERQLSYIGEELCTLGVDVLHCALAGFPGDREISREESRRRCVGLGVKSFWDPRVLFWLLRILKREKPDVLLSCVLVCDVFAFVLRCFSNSRWILREPNTVESIRARGIRRRLRVMIGKHADCVVANNVGGYDFWRNVRGDRLTVKIGNILYQERLEKLAQRRSNESKLVQGPYFLCVGRLVRQKNFKIALEAFSAVCEEDRGCQLVLLGDGPDRVELTRLAENLGIEGNVIFGGYVENPYPIIKDAEAVVLPSFYEGYPNVAMEAIALGTSVIISDIPVHRAAFSEQLVCFFLANNVACLAEKLKRNLYRNSGSYGGTDKGALMVAEWNPAKIGREYFQLIKKFVVNDRKYYTKT